METKPCVVCGTPIVRTPKDGPVRWSQRQVCSRKCTGLVPRIWKYVQLPETKNCQVCGREFRRPASYGAKQWSEKLYCSNTCAGEGRSRNAAARREQRVCPICGDQFSSRRPNQATCGKGECISRYKREVVGPRASATIKAQYASGREPARGTSAREDLLWEHLRKSGWILRLKWYEDAGSFELDFARLDDKVNVEIDGPEHFSPARRKRDAERDAELVLRGWRILRIPNAEVDADPLAVIAKITAFAG